MPDYKGQEGKTVTFHKRWVQIPVNGETPVAVASYLVQPTVKAYILALEKICADSKLELPKLEENLDDNCGTDLKLANT